MAHDEVRAEPSTHGSAGSSSGVRPNQAQGNPSKSLVLSARWCSQCHGVTPDEGSHNPDAPRFVDLAAERSATEYSLRVFFRTPHATMPNFVLNPDDIEDIISYILSMKPKR